MIDIANRSDMITIAKKMVNYASSQKVDLRLFGSIAVDIRCQPLNGFGMLLGNSNFTDIDFVGKIEQLNNADMIFNTFKFKVKEVEYSTNGEHRIYESSNSDYSNVLKLDIYFGKLTFNHIIPPPYFEESSKYTIPITQLLLSKLAIVDLKEKDKNAIILLLYRHDIGDNANVELIQRDYLIQIFCRTYIGWEISKTCLKNLNLVKTHVFGITFDDNFIQKAVIENIDELIAIIESPAKSITWKFRNFFGSKIKHYKDASASQSNN